MPLTTSKRIPIPPPAPGAPAPETNVLPARWIEQEQLNWCWAACCEMVFKMNGAITDSQCEIVTTRFAIPCCANPASDQCDRGEWPETVYPLYGYHCSPAWQVISFDDICQEIDDGRPVEVYYAWAGPDGGAHVALIVGYYSNGELEVFDPAYGPGPRTYDYIREAYGQGEWQLTYTEIHP
jgi:hypothetical protein